MTEPRATASRVFWPSLAAASVLAFVFQVLAIRAGASGNPFASTPQMDADVYWQWAAAIARGELQGETPFLSAPLYPYLLGALRAAGAGLEGVFLCQAGLHVASAILLALVGRRAFGPGVGLAAGLGLLVLSDPAYYAGRALNGSLLVFLSTVTLAGAHGLARNPGPARSAGLGFALGCLCLAHPPMLAALPLFALWVALQGERTSWARGAIALVAAAAAIAPATLHNRRASGEWIPISAQAGITFYHGNQPGSDGTYGAAQGVSTDRRQQNLDALDQARREGGADGWNAANRYYLSQGLSTWRADPVGAVALFLRKAYWFMTGRVYGDIYLPSLERAGDLPTTSQQAPLPVGLLTWPALIAILAWSRAFRRHLPEILLFAVPFAVVCFFWYSPRYRIPAAPVIALGAAWAGARIADWRSQRGLAVACSAAFALAAACLVLNPRLGFDAPATYRAQYDYTLGTLHLKNGDLARARPLFERAAAAGNAQAAIVLGDMKRLEGDYAGAVQDLAEAVRLRPEDAFARRSLGTALAQAGRPEEARAQLERARALNPNDWETLSNLGNVLRDLGDIPGAIAAYERAIELDPDFGDARYNLAVTLTRSVSPPRTAEALAQLREALRRRPGHPTYAKLLAEIEAQRP